LRLTCSGALEDGAGASLGNFIFHGVAGKFLFRGLLQNCLSRAMNNDLAGWVFASVLFGFSHITNGDFRIGDTCCWHPLRDFLWVDLAETNSIFASAIVHGAVDVLWHFFVSNGLDGGEYNPAVARSGNRRRKIMAGITGRTSDFCERHMHGLGEARERRDEECDRRGSRG